MELVACLHIEACAMFIPPARGKSQLESSQMVTIYTDSQCVLFQMVTSGGKRRN
jgi:hypothetical protein